jgi:hypothetical protein
MRPRPKGGFAAAMRVTRALISAWTGGRPLRAPPESWVAETTPLPSQDGVGQHEDQRLLPPSPDSGQPDPEQAVRGPKLVPGRRSPVHGKLLTQGQVLQGELAVAAAEEGQQTEHVE